MIDWIERNRGHILVTCINLSVLGAVVFWLRQPSAVPVEVVSPSPTPAAATPLPASLTPEPIRVYVTGAVNKPDVYQLPPESIVKDALEAAGGATADGDLQRVNLAQVLQDQQQITVPYQGQSEAVPVPISGGEVRGAASVNVSPTIDINTATADELETLSAIGPELAQRIVDYRTVHGPFGSIEEITHVQGIGEGTLQKIRESIRVSR